MIAQAAGFRDLHLGHEHCAPSGFVERIGASVMIAIKPVKETSPGIVSCEQGIHHAAIAMFVHQFVVITGAMPTTRRIQVRAVWKFRVVEMTGFVPAGNLEAAALDMEKIYCALCSLGEEQTAPDREGNGFGNDGAEPDYGAIGARLAELGKVHAPEIPAPIVGLSAVNATGAGGGLLPSDAPS